MTVGSLEAGANIATETAKQVQMQVKNSYCLAPLGWGATPYTV